MDIILLEDIEKVGDKHTIVTVKDGYARNFLIPQKKALIANDTNRRRLDDLRRREEAAENKKLSLYQEMAAKLEGQVLKIGAKAGTSGKIFGSVTNVQFVAALKDQLDLEVERKKIVLPDEIKTLGTYTATINFHKEVQPTIDFEVVSE